MPVFENKSPTRGSVRVRTPPCVPAGVRSTGLSASFQFSRGINLRQKKTGLSAGGIALIRRGQRDHLQSGLLSLTINSNSL